MASSSTSCTTARRAAPTSSASITRRSATTRLRATSTRRTCRRCSVAPTCCSSSQDWDNAGKAYTTLLVDRRDGQREADVARIYHRLGIVLEELGHRKKALAMFEKALELDPRHRDTLLAVIELQTQLGDWEAVVRAKRGLVETAEEREKTKLLEEVGALYQSRLQNPPKAAAAYVEALELAPDAHQLLQKLLDLYIDTKQWKKAVEHDRALRRARAATRSRRASTSMLPRRSAATS